jgi:peptidoglycan hydrolase CwlO-like protein
MLAERRELESARANLEKDCARLGARVEALMQQVKDKDGLVAQAMEATKSMEERKVGVEKHLHSVMQERDSLEQRLQSGIAEMQKGNETIRKLKKEITDANTNLTRKTEVIRRQVFRNRIPYIYIYLTVGLNNLYRRKQYPRCEPTSAN